MKRQMERRGLIWLLVLALAALLCACGQTAGSDAAPGSPAAAPVPSIVSRLHTSAAP